MHFQFLIEDNSGAVLIDMIMARLKEQHPEVTYNTKPFHGLGGFKRSGSVKEIKNGKLLHDLSIYLGGFDKSLQNYPAVIVVVLDNDDRDTDVFYHDLEEIAVNKGISIDHVFCIAVEEIEAWLLGDEAALLSAYPNAKLSTIKAYKQDSICGTWEVLAEAIYPGGLQSLEKNCISYSEIGIRKAEWARCIGRYMDFMNNKSPSFRHFIHEVNKRIETDCSPSGA